MRTIRTVVVSMFTGKGYKYVRPLIIVSYNDSDWVCVARNELSVRTATIARGPLTLLARLFESALSRNGCISCNGPTNTTLRAMLRTS